VLKLAQDLGGVQGRRPVEIFQNGGICFHHEVPIAMRFQSRLMLFSIPERAVQYVQMSYNPRRRTL
jgi:hypothetical protein